MVFTEYLMPRPEKKYTPNVMTVREQGSCGLTINSHQKNYVRKVYYEEQN
jgi:hypothetical protein